METEGAPHLQSPGAGLPFHVRYNLDIAATALALTVAAAMLLLSIAVKLWRTLRHAQRRRPVRAGVGKKYI